MPAFTDIPAYVRDAFTPQMRRVVEHQLDRLNGRADSGGDTIEAARAEYRDERSFWNVGGPVMHETRDTRIRAAGRDVPVRIHRPRAADALPAIVYLHGGGFTVGDLDTHDRITRVLADVSGAAVVAVDYALAPEAVFPQALHETAGIVAHLAAHGEQFGIDGGRLALAGDSAGAMLSLGSTLLLRDEPERVGDEAARAFASIRAMLLYYGGYGLADSVSARLYGGFWDGMGADELGTISEVYLTDAVDRQSPYVNHLSADLDAPLPAAYVIGAELDPLRDATVALGARLEIAGQDVSWRVVPGVLHSFLHFGRMLDEANEVLAAGAMFARRRLME